MFILTTANIRLYIQLVHKVRSGMTVEQAVDDIISRGVSELRKNAFGDDAEDAKNLPWSREQAWAVMKQLAKRTEMPYHDVLLEFPFKGDETPLREMEHAELITVNTENGEHLLWWMYARSLMRFNVRATLNDSARQAGVQIRF